MILAALGMSQRCALRGRIPSRPLFLSTTCGGKCSSTETWRGGAEVTLGAESRRASPSITATPTLGAIVAETVLQGLVGLSCLFLAGLNTMRGFLGGLFVGSSIVLATGLATGNTTFFLAVATVMSAVVVGRLIGIAVDGFDKKVDFPLVLEVVMVTIFFVAYAQLGARY